MPTPLEILAATHPDLQTSALAIYSALTGQDAADPYTTARLAAATRLNRRTVYDAIRELESRGVIVCVRTRGYDNRCTALVPSIHSGRA